MVASSRSPAVPSRTPRFAVVSTKLAEDECITYGSANHCVAGLRFVDAESRSEPQGLRESVNENGEKLLILNTDKKITHVGTSIYSGDKWVKIVAEVF